VQAGLRVLSRAESEDAAGLAGRAVLLLPVDCPMPGAEVVAALLARARQADSTGWAVIRPRHGGRHGHPLLLSADFAERVLTAPDADQRLDRWIASLPPGEALAVEVHPDAVLANFNFDGIRR